MELLAMEQRAYCVLCAAYRMELLAME